MKLFNEEQHQKRKIEIMEKCYECYAEYGLNNVGLKGLSKYCNISSGLIYNYFETLDDLIIQSTEYCMSKVEDDFMKKAPANPAVLEKYVDEIPYWTAETHGKKYRLMYQVYTCPKYRNEGKKFFNGVNKRYAEYAKKLEQQIGIPADILRPMIFTFVRACVHFALYEDELYLKEQIWLLKKTIRLFYEKYQTNN